MSSHINLNRAGLVLATIAGGWHLVWAVLVALGVAKPFIDFVFWIHFIQPIYMIEPFETARAAILVILTGALGYVVGAVFAMAWNAFHRA
jgi:hypothetical protein